MSEDYLFAIPEKPRWVDQRDELARNTDPDTSHEAAARLTTRKTHMRALLAVYQAAVPALTDEEAAEEAGLPEGGWKRCADLRKAGFIERVGVATSSKNRTVMTCRITDAGRTALGVWT